MTFDILHYSGHFLPATELQSKWAMNLTDICCTSMFFTFELTYIASWRTQMADSLTFVRVVQVVDRAAGALVVYAKSSYYKGDTVKLKEVGNQEEEYYAQMVEFTADDGTRVYAAIFPRLPHANYDIYQGYSNWGRTTVFAGAVVAFQK